jgi:anti-sigma28 factor (negative regulator of flagellin synthesis)
MKISDLFGRVNGYSNAKIGTRGKDASEGAGGSPEFSSTGADTMTISGKARMLAEVSRMNEQDEAARKDRIAAIKQKVQSGEYLSEISSDDVARKLDAFFANS